MLGHEASALNPSANSPKVALASRATPFWHQQQNVDSGFPQSMLPLRTPRTNSGPVFFGAWAGWACIFLPVAIRMSRGVILGEKGVSIFTCALEVKIVPAPDSQLRAPKKKLCRLLYNFWYNFWYNFFFLCTAIAQAIATFCPPCSRTARANATFFFFIYGHSWDTQLLVLLLLLLLSWCCCC